MVLYDGDDGPPQGGDGFFQATEQIDDNDDPATAIRVKLPPSEIEFGLGRSLGADAISVARPRRPASAPPRARECCRSR